MKFEGTTTKYIIVGTGKWYGGEELTKAVVVNGFNASAVDDANYATHFEETELEKANQVVGLLNQMATIFNIGVTYSVKKEDITYSNPTA